MKALAEGEQVVCSGSIDDQFDDHAEAATPAFVLY